MPYHFYVCLLINLENKNMLTSNNKNNLSLIDAVNNFSDSKLKRKEDLEKIFSAVTPANKNVFDTLLFKSKYIKGLMRIFKGSSSNVEFDKSILKKDLADNINQAKELLKNITRSAESDTKLYFESKYYVLDGESFARLDDLLSDLEWTKMYFNDAKVKK